MSPAQINEAVARKLGNWCDCGHKENEHSDGREFGGGPAVCSNAFCKCEEIEYPDYCHSIGAAWEILETLVSNRWNWQIQNDRELEKFSCWIGKADKQFEAYESTTPMAICLAFLKLEDKK